MNTSCTIYVAKQSRHFTLVKFTALSYDLDLNDLNESGRPTSIKTNLAMKNQVGRSVDM